MHQCPHCGAFHHEFDTVLACQSRIAGYRLALRQQPLGAVGERGVADDRPHHVASAPRQRDSNVLGSACSRCGISFEWRSTGFVTSHMLDCKAPVHIEDEEEEEGEAQEGDEAFSEEMLAASVSLSSSSEEGVGIRAASDAEIFAAVKLVPVSTDIEGMLAPDAFAFFTREGDAFLQMVMRLGAHVSGGTRNVISAAATYIQERKNYSGEPFSFTSYVGQRAQVQLSSYGFKELQCNSTIFVGRESLAEAVADLICDKGIQEAIVREPLAAGHDPSEFVHFLLYKKMCAGFVALPLHYM